MTKDSEIEDSLRVCQEIEGFIIHDDMAPEQNAVSHVFERDNETFREIDKILAEEAGAAAPVAPAESVTPVKPAEPVTPVAPAAPVKPVAPVTPVEPVTPVTPATPVEPVTPVTPVTPAAPVEMVSPVKPTEPTPVTASDTAEAIDDTAAPSEKKKKKKQSGSRKKKAEAKTAPEEAGQDSMLMFEPVASATGTEETYRERHPFLRALLGVLICMVLALTLSLVVTRFIAHHTSVEGSSMEATLSNGDQLIVENISYLFHDPERFDIVVFPYSDEVNYIKRIIGLPGETVQIEGSTIFINGEPIEESYGKEPIEDPGLAKEEIVLGSDEYFVLGDNRNASVDSRKEEVGPVKRSKIQGKAWLRFYPFSNFGFVS